VLTCSANQPYFDSTVDPNTKEPEMAKYRSLALRWKVVESDEVVGYRIYWSKGDKVTYDSPSVYVQDLDAIVIPDTLEGFVPEPGRFMFGISAVDRWANESDLTLLKEPLKISAPSAPASLWVEPVSVPPAPESVWAETIDVAVSMDIKKAPNEEYPLRANSYGTDDRGSHRLQAEAKKPSQQPPEFHDHLGLLQP
jgi:hypothetical protein